MANKSAEKRSFAEAFDVTPKNEICWINKLPAEVLTEILSYLPAVDLKSASVVCSSWYNASNEKSVRQYKKLVVQEFHRRSEVDAVLSECKWKWVNLEFRGVKFKENPSSFIWENLSSRVYRMNFICCKITPATAKCMISFCKHLQYLLLESDESLFTLLFNNLVDCEVRCERLQHLEIFESRTSLVVSKDIFEKVFPNLTSFKIKNWNICLQREITFKHLISKDHIVLPDFVMGFACDRATSYWKLKEVELMLTDDMANNVLNCIADFFGKNRHIEVITCKTFEESVDCPFLNHVVQQALHYCLNVRHLEIIRGILCEETLKAVLKCSTLKTIELKCITSRSDSLPENRTVSRLCLHDQPVYAPKNTVKQFLKLFTNLQHLSFSNCQCVTDKVLQLVWRYQTNLKTLEINNCPCSVKGLTGTSEHVERNKCVYTIGRLQKLECLKFGSISDEDSVPVATMNQFCFPQLRDLIVFGSYFKKIEDVTPLWLKLGGNSPLLEHLEMIWGRESFSVFLDFLRRQTRLRSLLIYDHDKLLQEERYLRFKNIFSHCPSLRSFTYETRFRHRIEYSYDILLGSMIEYVSFRCYQNASSRNYRM